jgi:hypothetical protein
MPGLAGRGGEVPPLKDTGAGGRSMKAERHGTAIVLHAMHEISNGTRNAVGTELRLAHRNTAHRRPAI